MYVKIMLHMELRSSLVAEFVLYLARPIIFKAKQKQGALRELNPGPPAP